MHSSQTSSLQFPRTILESSERLTSFWWIGLFSFFFFPIGLLRAAVRPLWFDELFTFYISRLSWDRIWKILSSGGEPNPPLCYALSHLSMRLFGQNEIALRLPAIFGFWLMATCIFLYVRRRSSPFPAFAAMCFPLVSRTYIQYGTEARPYGLVLGFCALSAVCWQLAIDGVSGRTRNIAVIGFSLTLMAAIMSHYYAVLLTIPFGIAELVRWQLTRRLHIKLSLALVCSLLPLAPLYPAVSRGTAFITSLVKTSQNFWAKPRWDNLPLFYYEYVGGAIVPLTLLAAVLLVYLLMISPGTRNLDAADKRQRTLPEAAMIVSLTALPIFATMLGQIATGSFLSRYALSAVVGCALLFGLITSFASARVPAVGLIAGLIFFGWFAKGGLHKPQSVPPQPLPDVSQVSASVPLVIADPLLFLQLFHYAPPRFARRIYYISDLDVAVKTPDFIPELALLQLRQWIQVPVEDYQRFVDEHPKFALYQDFEPRLEYILKDLLQKGYSLQLKANVGAGQVYEVEKPGKAEVRRETRGSL